MSMHQERTAHLTSTFAVLVLLSVGTAAYGQAPAPARSADVDNPRLADALVDVRSATGPYWDLQVAIADGYTEQYPAGCAEAPEGVQGFHYMNPDLVDGEIDLHRPELIMYEPQADGSMRLIGVDYVVPFDRWTGERPPTLLGVEFARNEPLGVWALHIWAWRENPSGVFAMWNPNASCEHAAELERS